MRILSLAHSTGGISLVAITQAIIQIRGTTHSGTWTTKTHGS